MSGKSFDPVLIPKAIHDAGFTATAVDAVVDGTLAARNGSLELEVPGLKHPFVLSGGPERSALNRESDLVGKKIQITGRVGATHGSAPTMTVEGFKPSR
jgi:hypothetical protein